MPGQPTGIGCTLALGAFSDNPQLLKSFPCSNLLVLLSRHQSDRNGYLYKNREIVVADGRAPGKNHAESDRTPALLLPPKNSVDFIATKFKCFCQFGRLLRKPHRRCRNRNCSNLSFKALDFLFRRSTTKLLSLLYHIPQVLRQPLADTLRRLRRPFVESLACLHTKALFAKVARQQRAWFR